MFLESGRNAKGERFRLDSFSILGGHKLWKEIVLARPCGLAFHLSFDTFRQGGSAEMENNFDLVDRARGGFVCGIRSFEL